MKTMAARLRRLEQKHKPVPELKCLWKQPGETWEQLRERGRAWQAEKPETRRIEPMLIGCKDEDECRGVNRNDTPRRFYE